MAKTKPPVKTHAMAGRGKKKAEAHVNAGSRVYEDDDTSEVSDAESGEDVAPRRAPRKSVRSAVDDVRRESNSLAPRRAVSLQRKVVKNGREEEDKLETRGRKRERAAVSPPEKGPAVTVPAQRRRVDKKSARDLTPLLSSSSDEDDGSMAASPSGGARGPVAAASRRAAQRTGSTSAALQSSNIDVRRTGAGTTSTQAARRTGPNAAGSAPSATGTQSTSQYRGTARIPGISAGTNQGLMRRSLPTGFVASNRAMTRTRPEETVQSSPGTSGNTAGSSLSTPTARRVVPYEGLISSPLSGPPPTPRSMSRTMEAMYREATGQLSPSVRARREANRLAAARQHRPVATARRRPATEPRASQVPRGRVTQPGQVSEVQRMAWEYTAPKVPIAVDLKAARRQRRANARRHSSRPARASQKSPPPASGDSSSDNMLVSDDASEVDEGKRARRMRNPARMRDQPDVQYVWPAGQPPPSMFAPRNELRQRGEAELAGRQKMEVDDSFDPSKTLYIDRFKRLNTQTDVKPVNDAAASRRSMTMSQRLGAAEQSPPAKEEYTAEEAAEYQERYHAETDEIVRARVEEMREEQFQKYCEEARRKGQPLRKITLEEYTARRRLARNSQDPESSAAKEARASEDDQAQTQAATPKENRKVTSAPEFEAEGRKDTYSHLW